MYNLLSTQHERRPVPQADGPRAVFWEHSGYGDADEVGPRHRPNLLRQSGRPASGAPALVLPPPRHGCDRPKQLRASIQSEARIRLVKNGAADALAAIRPVDADPRARVFGGLNGQSIGRRFAAAARAAGIEGVTAHSGRVG